MSVFVSYSSKDTDLAKKLCAMLKSNHIEHWIAYQNAAHGVSFASSITDAIDKASVMLLVLSPDAAASPHVLNEVNYAFTNGKTILPVVVGNVTLSGQLAYYLGSQNLLPYAAGAKFKKELLSMVNTALVANGHEPIPTIINGQEYHSKNHSWLKWVLIPLLLIAMAVVGWFMAGLLKGDTTNPEDLMPPMSNIPTEEAATTTPTVNKNKIEFNSAKTQRVSFSATAQTWAGGSLVMINEQAGARSDVADYSHPVRLYKDSTITITCPGMTELVLETYRNANEYTTGLKNTLEHAGLTYTEDGAFFTVTFDQPVNSITLTAVGQVRLYSLSAYGWDSDTEAVSTTTTTENTTTTTTTTAAPTDSDNFVDFGSQYNQIPDQYATNLEEFYYSGPFADLRTQTIQVGEKLTPFLASNGSYSASYSSDTRIATVDGKIITGVTPGTTYIVLINQIGGSAEIFKIVVTE